MSRPTDAAERRRTFELSCLDCPFEATVVGDVFDALDAVDDHQDDAAADPAEHFVEFERVDE